MIIRSATFGCLALATLSLVACVESESPPSAGTPETPTAAEQACLVAVSREANNGDVTLLGSEFSQAGTFVRVGVGPQRAPWQCVAGNSGDTWGVEFTGDDSAGAGATQLPGPTAQAPTPAEQACLAAVSRETNNGDVMLLGSEFSQAGTFVRVGVGPQRAPWKCVANASGETWGVEYMGTSG